MDLSRSSAFFRLGAAVLVMAVALVMLVACHGDMHMLIPVAVCAIILTAVVTAPLAALAFGASASMLPLGLRRVRAGPERSQLTLSGPPLLRLTGVLRV